MSVVRPTDITVNRQTSEFSVTWSDEHLSIYPFTLLRQGCPCAECRGGHENMHSEPDPEMFVLRLNDSPATHIHKVEAVGSYAVTIEWEDGHNFGIYNWSYLRALCPCPICRGL